jgi:hypothetical protein
VALAAVRAVRAAAGPDLVILCDLNQWWRMAPPATPMPHQPYGPRSDPHTPNPIPPTPSPQPHPPHAPILPIHLQNSS